MRKLASIQRVKTKHNIPKADRIELCTIQGWGCITKKGEMEIGDLAVYFEIDSFLPNIPMFEFLGTPKLYNDKLGFRLKTIKLKKTISQGLLLPFKYFKEEVQQKLQNAKEGDDVTELLGIVKCDNADALRTGGIQAGNPYSKFPSFIPKTDL